MSGTRQATGPAAPASPASSALHQDKLGPTPVVRWRLPADEKREGYGPSGAMEPESFLDEQAAITAGFRRMLSGSLRLRREERIAAVRAARDWLWQALKALSEKRASAARVRKALRRMQAPRPS